jgi:hypothetical protein
MKKAWMVALVLGVASTVAWGQTEVTSVNVVGFSKVTINPAGQFNLLSLPFDSIDPADANLRGVFGTNTLSKLGIDPVAMPPAFADELWMWDPSDLAWKTYYQGDDNNFYDANEWPILNAVNPAIQPGTGFFPQSSVLSTETNVIALMGEVVMVGTQQVGVAVGFQTLGYPFSSKIAVQDTSFKTLGNSIDPAILPPPLADNIWIWDNATGTYLCYFLANDGKWYDSNQWPTLVEATFDLELGGGFWYQAVGSFTWVETNKYLNNL